MCTPTPWSRRPRPPRRANRGSPDSASSTCGAPARSPPRSTRPSSPGSGRCSPSPRGASRPWTTPASTSRSSARAVPTTTGPIPAVAERITRLTNEGIAAASPSAPDRLLGLGTVAAAAPRSRDGRARLAPSPSRASRRPDLHLGSARARAGRPGARRRSGRAPPRLGAVVFIHPCGCSLDERLDRYYLSNTVGNPVETAVALSHIVFSGRAGPPPGAALVAAHGGGYLPTYIGRADHAWQVRPEARRCARPPSSYLRRIWFDSLVYTPTGLRHLVRGRRRRPRRPRLRLPLRHGRRRPARAARRRRLPSGRRARHPRRHAASAVRPARTLPTRGARS